MKFFLVLILIFSYANAEIPLPSVSPINVFEYDKDVRGIGYYQFNVENYEYDYGYDTPIPMGSVGYEASGFMYLWPKFDTYEVFGLKFNHFESAISVGSVDVTLNTKANPNNYLDKSGIFVGYHPSFSSPLYESKDVNIALGASLPLVLYNISGDWHVVGTNIYGYEINDGVYEDDTYGIAFKPTLTAQGSFYITNDFAISAYVGLIHFTSIGVNYYYGEKWGEEDSELEVETVGPKYIFGYDISYKEIFSQDDSISFFSALEQPENSKSENLVEYRLLYMFKF